MHESTIARTLFNDAYEMAIRSGINMISRIRIKVGIASGVDVDMLRHSLLDHVFPETIAEDAQIEVSIEPLIAKCRDCSREITEISATGACPLCASKDLDIIGGMKVVVEEVG